MHIVYFVSAILVSFVCACLGTRVASLLVNDFSSWLKFPGEVEAERGLSRDRLSLRNEPFTYVLSLGIASAALHYVLNQHSPSCVAYLAYLAGLIGALGYAALLIFALVIAWVIFWAAYCAGYIFRRRLDSLDFIDRLYAAAKDHFSKEKK